MTEARRFLAFVRRGGAGLRRLPAGLRARLHRLHGDERGTISILTVLSLLGLTMLMGLLLNVGEQVDDKLRLQNAADAATWSGGVMIARGMNALAFTNHLEAEVFALTAYMREGRDRNAESFVPQILAAWERAGRAFQGASFTKFAQLGSAIPGRVPLEQELVTAFGEMTAIKSRVTLPVLETILGRPEEPPPMSEDEYRAGIQSHLIPQFQRAVVRVIPAIAQLAAGEIARRHGPVQPHYGRDTPLAAALWRMRAAPCGLTDEANPHVRTLPGLDPAWEGPDIRYFTLDEAAAYQQMARVRREQLARHYLERWISDRNFDLGPFEREMFAEGGMVSGKMSQFINLWRIFTCGQLTRLLDVEYPNTNLPHMIRHTFPAMNLADPDVRRTVDIEHDYSFVGVVYWKQRRQTFPGLYRSPLRSADAIAFAQAVVFIPRPRYTTANPCPVWFCPSWDWRGSYSCGTPCLDAWPTEWNLFSQNWTTELVPAAGPGVPTILQTAPGDVAPSVRLPDLGGLTAPEMNAVNFH